MTRRLPAVFAALVVTVALAGCVQGETAGPITTTSADAEPAVPAAAGETITGTGYSYVVPEGWGVPADEVSGYDPDSLAVDLQDTDGFADNVNVLVTSGGAVTPEQIETLGVDQLEAGGATDVGVGERTSVGGSESAHLTATLVNGDVEYAVDQFYASQGDQLYIITFSFSGDEPVADRDAVAQSVLATWTWE